MSVTTAAFALLGGWLIDRFSAVRLLPLFLFAARPLLLRGGLADGLGRIFIFMTLLGVSYGFSSTLEDAMWPEIYGTRAMGGDPLSVVVAAHGLVVGAGSSRRWILRGYPPKPYETPASGISLTFSRPTQNARLD